MAVLLISFLALMILGCLIAFASMHSTLYFVTNDMALIMLVQRSTEAPIPLPFWCLVLSWPEPDEQRGVTDRF